jgi:TPR repeat protein
MSQSRLVRERCRVAPPFIVLLSLGAAAMATIPPCAAETPAQGGPARECLRLNDTSFDGDWDEQARMRRTWVEVCRQAVALERNDLRLKHVLARALTADGQREEAIGVWRELGEQNDADALFEIYDLYKSYYRSDANAPQLVKRAEAEHALRKAAELGHAYATLMLAVLLDRGDTVKRDPADAIHWAERAVANPSKDVQVADMQVLLGRLQVKSSDPAERARGIALLEKLAEAGRSDARTELAIAIRASDPARARALLEQALSGYAGGAIPPLADMLIKGEGSPANPKRTVSLLAGRRASDVPGVKGALGLLYVEGKVVPRDLKKGTALLRTWAAWNYDARLQLLQLLADNPDLTIDYPGSILYDATEAAELGEPGAAIALIDLKLSQNAQFHDKLGGCTLAERAAKSGDEAAARRLSQCGAD